MTARDRRRLDGIALLAHEARKLERELDRRLRRAHVQAGYSLRTLESATGIPRATLARRIGGPAE